MRPSPDYFGLWFSVADMTFTHEGNKTHFDGLVNFEKMVSVDETFEN